MNRQIFVNLPVKDLPRAMDFFGQLGFDFEPKFTDETAACMVISSDIDARLRTEEKFQSCNPKQLCDASQFCEVLTCLSCHSREEVDELVQKAIAAGGATYIEPKDYGFMYSHGFMDLDHHIWELVYMDPKAV